MYEHFTFLRRFPCTSRASNILWVVNNLEGDTNVHNEIEKLPTDKKSRQKRNLGLSFSSNLELKWYLQNIKLISPNQTPTKCSNENHFRLFGIYPKINFEF